MTPKGLLDGATEQAESVQRFSLSVPMVISSLVVISLVITGCVAAGLPLVMGRSIADFWLGGNQIVTGFNDRYQEIQKSGEPLPIEQTWNSSPIKKFLGNTGNAIQQVMNGATGATPQAGQNQNQGPLYVPQSTPVSPSSGTPESVLPQVPAATQAQEDPAVVAQIQTVLDQFRKTGDVTAGETALKAIKLTPGVQYPEWSNAWQEMEAWKANLNILASAQDALNASEPDLSKKVATAQQYKGIADDTLAYMQQYGMNNVNVQQVVSGIEAEINQLATAVKGYNDAQDAWKANNTAAAVADIQSAFNGTTWKITVWKDVIVSTDKNNHTATITCQTQGPLNGATVNVPTDLLKQSFPSPMWMLPGSQVGSTVSFGNGSK